MKCKILAVAVLTALALYGHAEETSKEYYDLGAETRFITIFCHGFDNYIHEEPKEFYGPMSSYFKESVNNADKPRGSDPNQ